MTVTTAALNPVADGRRRRPSGRPPPLPHPVQATGVGWLAAMIVLVAMSLVLFAGELSDRAVAVTAVDDAIVHWIAGWRAPGLPTLMRALAAAASWAVITALLWSLLLCLLILRRLRHAVVVLFAWIVQGLMIQYFLAPWMRRPRPFGVEYGTDWTGWAMPSVQLAAFAVPLVGITYGLLPQGRRRRAGKWAAVTLVTLVAIARIHLGVEAPSDVLVGVTISVAISLLAFRLFAPNEAFPITYRRGRAAHLDVGGARGAAIRGALREQLGLVVSDVEPFGLAGSAGSTPLRIRIAGDADSFLFGKLYARQHLRADRWYKLGRELLYGRMEDEKPFHTVRRLVQQEDYALHKMHLAGLPTPQPYGFVELTPDREYLLVTEFFAGATELGDVDVDEQLIDEGLTLIRRLWETGLAHRDIKPANLLVRDGHLLLIDVAFVQARPSPWRQAVDLANMMLCLALRSDPDRVYQRARRQFSDAEISEAFAAARGLALPSQLRRMIRDQGRDLHAEFIDLLPATPRPIRIQRWSPRRIGILLLVLPAAAVLLLSVRLVLVNNDAATTPLAIGRLDCTDLEPQLLEAQSVPSATMVPCVRSLPAGWTFGAANVRSGWSRFTLDHDRLGQPALVVRLSATCDTTGATAMSPAPPDAQRFVRQDVASAAAAATWYTVFRGGCVTARLRPTSAGDPMRAEAVAALGVSTRGDLQQSLDDRSDGRLRLDPES